MGVAFKSCIEHLGEDFWPETTTMRNNLHGTISDLWRTASFIAATGLPMLSPANEMKKKKKKKKKKNVDVISV